MCIEKNAEDFVVIHHELGHIFYYQAYNHLPSVYRSGANDGFHEAVGDLLSLSITPDYLTQIGLVTEAEAEAAEAGASKYSDFNKAIMTSLNNGDFNKMYPNPQNLFPFLDEATLLTIY